MQLYGRDPGCSWRGEEGATDSQPVEGGVVRGCGLEPKLREALWQAGSAQDLSSGPRETGNLSPALGPDGGVSGSQRKEQSREHQPPCLEGSSSWSGEQLQAVRGSQGRCGICKYITS